MIQSGLDSPVVDRVRAVPRPLVSRDEPTQAGGIVIKPPRGWQFVNVRELWQYRELVFFLAWRDVKVRYKQTVLGIGWAVLQPAMMMLVFTVFFGRLAGLSAGDLPYPVFALAGLLPWMLFSSIVTNAANSVVGSERLITKIYFPRLSIPFASAGAAAVDFAVALVLLAAVGVGYGIWPSSHLCLAPLIVAVVFLAAVGLGTLLAALNVSYRDVRYVIPFLIQLLMFATPTIYLQPNGNEGPAIRLILTLNPLNNLVSGFRASLLGGPVPWAGLGIASVLSVLMFVAGCMYFRRVESGFADQI
jgi:lipopolysaccharide transport system permease protein